MTYFNHTRTLFQYERATYNGVKGYFATRYIAGVYAGKQFGITRTAARNAFNNSER